MMFSAAIFAIYCFLVFCSYAFRSDAELTKILIFFWLFGSAVLCAFAVQHDTAPATTLLFVIVLLFGVCAIAIRPALLNFTMRMISVRFIPRDLVIVTPSEHRRLDELARQSGLSIRFCELPRSALWATRDARVVWQRIGTTAYVRLQNQDDAEHSLLVPIAQDNLAVIRPERIQLNCEGTLSRAPTEG